MGGQSYLTSSEESSEEEDFEDFFSQFETKKAEEASEPETDSEAEDSGSTIETEVHSERPESLVETSLPQTDFRSFKENIRIVLNPIAGFRWTPQGYLRYLDAPRCPSERK